jgi:hypothetical protein
MSTTNEAYENISRINKIMLAEMSREFPAAQIGIIWQDSTTAIHTAFDAPTVIAAGQMMGKIVSEVLTSKEDYQNLCKTLGKSLVDVFS